MKQSVKNFVQNKYLLMMLILALAGCATTQNTTSDKNTSAKTPDKNWSDAEKLAFLEKNMEPEQYTKMMDTLTVYSNRIGVLENHMQMTLRNLLGNGNAPQISVRPMNEAGMSVQQTSNDSKEIENLKNQMAIMMDRNIAFILYNTNDNPNTGK
ncbi:MAG: hypothetical protein FWC51_04550 [Proteobacteria bacterium]|nr:hypothetical protein [Pseudomonadota bacterium]